MDDLLAWLCKTPQTTTIRVNLLKTTPELLRQQIQDNLTEMTTNHSHLMPKVLIHNTLTDVITIEPLHTTNFRNEIVVQSDPNLKEVIVDVSCGASILRGAHLYAPGVLAMQAQTVANERVNIYADVEGSCKKGTNTIYDSTKKVFVGIGVVQMLRYQLYGADVIPRYLPNITIIVS